MPAPHRPARPRRAAAALFAALLATLLGGCASGVADGSRAVEPGVLPDIAARERALDALTRFRVRGGLGIWNDEVAHSARLDWRQDGERLELVLDAPLGLGRARLLADADEARLGRGDAAPLVADSAEELLQRALGLSAPVPLAQLALWLRGLPGEARVVARDAAGRLRELDWRDGGGARWRARVLDYVTVDGLELPRLLTARGSGYRMRLSLRDWSTSPGDDSVTPSEGERGGPDESPRPPRRLPVPGR